MKNQRNIAERYKEGKKKNQRNKSNNPSNKQNKYKINKQKNPNNINQKNVSEIWVATNVILLEM